ncbi:MAG: RNase adapter RapZ [Bacteroidota bacterium]|nr:RNase adapter RapZ [Bacteroidota bacterium]
MSEKEKLQYLVSMFQQWSGEKVQETIFLPPSGSYREYYRMISPHSQAIGVYNEDHKENLAFLNFTRHFFSIGLPVPQLYAEDLPHNVYLLEDLGDTTLLNYLNSQKEIDNNNLDFYDIYKKIINILPTFQIKGGKDLDYSYCYPRAAFDKQSMMWDLNYFKYYFLKLAKIPFDEQNLENDFQTFSDFLLQADSNYFLYRDFQSRNIMLKDGKVFFIDYQGGRRGALQYDLASLLFEAKTNLPFGFREELLEYYIQQLNLIQPVETKTFKKFYYGFVLIRMLQAMGAYGFRGFYEKKTLFLQSIPGALRNVEWWLKNADLPLEIPELRKVLELLNQSEFLKEIVRSSSKLTVEINSFSYRRGIPVDESGNGGGFVFDCRFIHNPGRYDKYKDLTGQDEEVKKFFTEQSEMDDFLKDVFSMIDRAVKKYQQRHYQHLVVNFGCTGGQHRSVYAAEQLSKHLSSKYDISIIVRHRERESIH